VLGDRLSRKLMMEGSAAACAVSQGLLAVLLIGDWATLPILAVVGMVTGCLGALSNPSSSAMTRLTVPAEDLSSAVAVRRVLQTGSMVVGFAIAGILVAAVGSGWAIAVDGATFVVAALAFGRLRVPYTRPEGVRPSLRADLAEGLREVFRHTWLWLLIGQALLYHLFYGGAQGVLGPIVIGDEFGRSAWGFALGALMVGFLAGGLICLRWRPRHGLYAGTILLSMTAAFPIAMAVSDHLLPILIGAFLHGLGLEIFSVNWDLAIQQNIDEDKLARVYSFDLVGSFVARPIGLALTGPVAAAVGFDTWLLVVGTIMGVSSLLALLSPDVRHLERRT
jgi:MFS family permease